MNSIKTLLIIALGAFSVQQVQAQTGMMDPVSFKLKNGLTVIVAENQSASKVFSNLSIESEDYIKSCESAVSVLLTAILNESASKDNRGITFDEKGGNIAVLTKDFENTLTSLSSIVQKPAIDQSLLDLVKSKVIVSLKSGDYSYPESITPDALNSVTLNQVKEFEDSEIIPSNAFLTIAGNVSPSEVKALVKKIFGDWEEI